MDIVNFTPLPAFIGGSLIGLSAALLMYFNGRVAGVSGIAGGVILPEKGDLDWRIVFVIGLIIGGGIYQLLHRWTGIGVGVQHIESVVGTPLLIAG
ncbi:MAG: YeeE/YedE family protein, partial [Natronospirillum sp.]